MNTGVELDAFVKMGSIELMVCVWESPAPDNVPLIQNLMGLIACAWMVITLLGQDFARDALLALTGTVKNVLKEIASVSMVINGVQ